MIEKKITTIALATIDLSDDTWRFTSPANIDPLVKSIRQVGLVNPIVVQFKDAATFRVVCGFKRAAALAALKVDSVPVFVIDASAPPLDVFFMAIQDNQSVIPLNPIELSTIIHKLQSVFDIDDSEIVASWLPRLGFGRNPKVLQLHSGLHRLSKEWQAAIVEDRVALDFAQEMLAKPEKERDEIWRFIRALRLGKNKQRDLIGLMSDVAQIDEMSLPQLFESQPVQDVLNENKLTPSQKAEKLKQWLWKKRYPRYSKVKSDYDAIVRDGKLPHNIFVQSPPYFEGAHFTLGFTFSSERDVADALETLTEFLQKGSIKKIIDLT